MERRPGVEHPKAIRSPSAGRLTASRLRRLRCWSSCFRRWARLSLVVALAAGLLAVLAAPCDRSGMIRTVVIGPWHRAAPETGSVATLCQDIGLPVLRNATYRVE